MIETTWLEIPTNYSGVRVDRHSVMPNHLHGIIVLGNIPSPTEGEAADTKRELTSGSILDQQEASTSFSLHDIVGRFKSLTTFRYTQGVKELGWARFDKRLWQRDYHEHVIRDSRDWIRIVQYIDENPIRWHEDPENPELST